MSEWQPITVAPKDGTRFIAYTPDGGIDFFRWQDFTKTSPSSPKGWRDSFITVYAEDSKRGPVAWMPLPMPPK